MNYLKGFIYCLCIVCFVVVSCQDDEKFDTSSSARIHYSTDTITFDTIFTTIGSVTKRFKVYNRNSQSVRISDAFLRGGEGSKYRINVDGRSGISFNDIDIQPNDSLYVFVEVTLDPNEGNLPVIVSDEIVFISNGNEESVILEAFGQDVHLFKERTYIKENTTWENNKPYLFLKELIVDTGIVLTLKEGIRVHFHDKSNLVVYGKLQVEGSLENPVVFEGDRFDRGFDRSAGRWNAIHIAPISVGNTINYAIIKNPNVGIWVGRPDMLEYTPQLTLSNTVIQNSSSAHILSYGGEIDAYNCVFADSKIYSLALTGGGKYNFYHCSSSIPGAFRVDAGLFEKYERDSDGFGIFLSNWGYFQNEGENILIIKELTEANFYNCIFWGTNIREIYFDDNKETGFNYYFDHCILRQPESRVDTNDATHYKNILLNEYPRFVNDSALNGKQNFRLDTLSPAKDAGSIDIVNKHSFLELDLAGNKRTTDGKPDLGAYERIE